jgi:hypothetical protein
MREHDEAGEATLLHEDVEVGTHGDDLHGGWWGSGAGWHPMGRVVGGPPKRSEHGPIRFREQAS